jgi:hypothetical protein
MLSHRLQLEGKVQRDYQMSGSFFCERCGWHPCRCESVAERAWRELERERQASGIQIYRVSWVCTHGRHDVPQMPTSTTGGEHPWRTKSYENAMSKKRRPKLGG